VVKKNKPPRTHKVHKGKIQPMVPLVQFLSAPCGKKLTTMTPGNTLSEFSVMPCALLVLFLQTCQSITSCLIFPPLKTIAMLVESLKLIFNRDLLKLKEEILSYQHEENLWLVEGAISNTAGNLCLHLIGNLNTFIGAEIGHSGYVRNRLAEFGDKFIPKQFMAEQIDKLIISMPDWLDKMKASELEEEYRIPIFGGPIKTGLFLVHLATHLTYHLGQINYHRRLLDK
jgi:hypothetical protein